MDFRIGICDDNKEQTEILTSYVRRFQSLDALSVSACTEPGNFLQQVENDCPHILFLDIDMPGINGIRLGERIRELNPAAVVIYVTGHEEYALEAFRVRAFHYLTKPLKKETFESVLAEAIAAVKKVYSEAQEKNLLVKKRGEIVALPYGEILYFEKIGHKVLVHTDNLEISYYNNFGQLMEELASDSFIQCHQGYIVNIRKVKGLLGKTLLLPGGHFLPVSRSFSEPVKNALAKVLFAGKERE